MNVTELCLYVTYCQKHIDKLCVSLYNIINKTHKINRKRLNYDYVTSCDGTIVDSDGEVLPEPEIPEPEEPVDDYQCFSYAVREENGSTLSEIKIVEYKYDGETCGSDVVIPERINDKIVSEIGESAFATHGSVITNVSIPNNVTKIGDQAFQEQLLTSVAFHGSTWSELQTIGNYAFAGNDLTSFPINYNTDYNIEIGNYAFYDNKLIDVNFWEHVTKIGNYAFASNELKSIVKSSNKTTRIGEHAFSNNKLERLNWSGIISEMGVLAFSHNQLTDGNLSLNADSIIGAGSFNDNQFIEEAFFSNGDTLISYGGAERSLDKIQIPSFDKIGDYAFAECYLTGNLDLGGYNSYGSILATTIGSHAFYRNNLSHVGIKNKNVYLIEDSFADSFGNDSSYYFYAEDRLKDLGDVVFPITIPMRVTSGTELVTNFVHLEVMATPSESECYRYEFVGTGGEIEETSSLDAAMGFDKHWCSASYQPPTETVYAHTMFYWCPSYWSSCPKK